MEIHSIIDTSLLKCDNFVPNYIEYLELIPKYSIRIQLTDKQYELVQENCGLEPSNENILFVNYFQRYIQFFELIEMNGLRKHCLGNCPVSFSEEIKNLIHRICKLSTENPILYFSISEYSDSYWNFSCQCKKNGNNHECNLIKNELTLIRCLQSFILLKIPEINDKGRGPSEKVKTYKKILKEVIEDDEFDKTKLTTINTIYDLQIKTEMKKLKKKVETRCDCIIIIGGTEIVIIEAKSDSDLDHVINDKIPNTFDYLEAKRNKGEISEKAKVRAIYIIGDKGIKGTEYYAKDHNIFRIHPPNKKNDIPVNYNKIIIKFEPN